jgi:alpha-methylacyl-CoA racemase
VLRGRPAILLDLKRDADVGRLTELAGSADVLLEGLRPGVAERLGVGPERLLEANPRLVYARITGWGQDGPLARTAGHDLNYLGLTGALHAMGRPGEPPAPPLNLVADFGGGSMLLVLGVLAALVERGTSGRGQVVDAAMVDGVALLSQMTLALTAMGAWGPERGTNLLDGGAPFYDTYACADGGHVAVGALEPQFYAALLEGLGLDPASLPDQQDRSGWPVLRQTFTSAFAARTRDEWAERFAGTDACVTPVLTFEEAAVHPHLAARETYVRRDGVLQAAPAPRFSRTPGGLAEGGGAEADLDAVLTRWRATARDQDPPARNQDPRP